MADFVSSVFASNLTSFEEDINLLLSSLLNNNILSVSIATGDKVSYIGKELQFGIRYDDAGSVISSPYKIKVYDSGNLANAVAEAQAFITANPSYWYADLILGYLEPTRNAEPYVVYLFYNEEASEGGLNWYAGGVPLVLSGDVTGFLFNNTVEKIQNNDVASTAPTGGATLVWNDDTSRYEPVLPVQYFADSAALVAAAPFVDNTRVVLSPGSPTSEAGTYNVDSNGGVSFPADYTKISDTTETADEVAITDSGGFYPLSSNVEEALQALGPLNRTNIQGPVSLAASSETLIDEVLVDNVGGVVWELYLIDDTTGDRINYTVQANHDGTVGADASSAKYTVNGLGPENSDVLNILIDLSGAGAAQTLRLRVEMGATSDWSAYFKQVVAFPA